MPSRPKDFVEQFLNYVVEKYETNESKRIICKLINCNIKELNTKDNYYKNLHKWFLND